MSDQDNLRDRIAAALDRNFNPDQYPIMAAMFRDYAQAIIDEFELTVEKGEDFLTWSHGGDAAKVPGGVRIVGKWEKQ